MSRDNASQRVLGARRTLCGTGTAESLENTFGRTLSDGAQCFVIEEQANYRFVAQCAFPEDGQYVITPKGDKFGRWLRAEGLVGFALLEGGRFEDDRFGGFTYQKLVQFEVTPEALVYMGTIPRLAHLSALAQNTSSLQVTLLQGEPRDVASGAGSANGVALLHPGERIVLRGTRANESPVTGGSLQVILA